MEIKRNIKSKIDRKEWILRNILFPLLIFITVVTIYFLNYKSGTWLMGWDNLLPEFDFGINWERHIFSSWQEYQGVGLEGGVSWAADLPRVITTWLFGLFLPTNMIRYTYIFYCLLVGSLGIYFFSNWLLIQIQKKQKSIQIKPVGAIVLSFVISQFYIFNHGTLETFYAPIETFPTQWAFLPWLIYLFLKSIKEGGKTNYLKYAIVSLLATPMAQVPTTYIMFAIFLTVSTILILISSSMTKSFRITLKRVVKLALITFAINAFWIIPFLSFYISGGAKTVQESSINQIFSEDIYYRNAARGKVDDTSLLRGYLYDTYDMNTDVTKFEPMMLKWIEHYKQPLVLVTGYLFFAIIVLGLVYSIYKRFPYWQIFTTMFMISLFFLGASNPPFGIGFDWLRENIPIFREAMRFPYTKIAQIATFIYSINFLFGLLAIRAIVKRVLTFDSTLILTLVTLYSLTMYMLPAFQGHFIYEGNKVTIPKQYFEMFEWFKTQPKEARIANIPQNEHINWYFYDWGYRGSGFLWYGLRQPVLDRSFDSWSEYNEQYFVEMRQAIYSNNTENLATIMEKYNIGWILYDGMFQVGEQDKKYYEEVFIPNLLKDERFKLVNIFGEEIRVIEYEKVLQNPSFVKPLSDYNIEKSISGKQFVDLAFRKGNYIESPSNYSSYILRDIEDFEQNLLTNFNTQNYTYSFLIDTSQVQGLEVPEYWSSENYIPLEIYRESGKKYLKPILPTILIDSKEITANTPKRLEVSQDSDLITSSIDVLKISDLSNKHITAKKGDILSEYKQIPRSNIKVQTRDFTFRNCITNKTGVSDYNLAGEIISLRTDNGEPCIEKGFITKKENTITKLTFQYRSETGNYPTVCLRDSLTNSCIPEIKLSSLKFAKEGYETYTNYFFTESNRKYTLKVSLHSSNAETNKEVNINLKEFQIEQFSKSKNLFDTREVKTSKVIDLLNDSQVKEVTVSFPILTETSLSERVNLEDLSEMEPVNCFGEGVLGEKSQIETIYNKGVNKITFNSTNANNCLKLWNRDRLPLDANYVFTVDSNNIKNYPLELQIYIKPYQFYSDKYLLNSRTSSTKVVPQTREGDVGLTIELHNLSRGHFKSVNSISSPIIQFYPIDYISNFFFKTENSTITQAEGQFLTSQRVTPFLYVVKPQTEINGIMLNQSFSNGWIILNGANTNQYKANSWSNAWINTEESSNVFYIVFMPQFIQLLAYLLLPLPFFWLHTISPKRAHSIVK